ncbi:MAG: hypothetical protein U0324_21450 [Polyangiales bacterium]
MWKDLADELVARLGRPQRARLDDARAAVAACSRSRLGALEALAARGVIPAEWVGDPGRWFRVGPRRAEPLKSTHAVALAADVAGVLAAEELAREYVQRLRPYGGPARVPAVALWTFRTRKLYAPCGFTADARRFAQRYARLDRALWEVFAGENAPPKGIPPGRGTSLRHTSGGWMIYETSVMFEDLWQHARLRAAAARGLSMRVRVLSERWWTLPPPAQERVEWVRYDALPDPFEPLLAIWRLGYALGAFDEEKFELFAPPAQLEP